MRQLLRRRHALLFILALATATLTLAACGGGEEAAPEETTAPATTAAPAATTEEAPATTEAATTEAAATTEEAAPEPASLRVALDWFPNPDHVSLYYALENGYWEDQALTVELKTPSDPTAGLKLVATNKFDLAIFYEGDMFFAAEQGLPVIAVGALIPTPLNSMIALADSKVKGPETIKGATIGVAGLPFDDAILKTMRDQQGLSEGDVKKVNVGFNLVPALLTGKADAVIGAYWNIEADEIEIETGVEPTVIQLEQLGVPHYDELLVVANKERLDSDPAYADAIERFLAGMIKGAESAIADEAGSIEIMKANTEYTAEQIEAMVPTTLGVLESPSGLPLGCFDLEGWATFGQWMLDNDLLKAEIDPSTIATNDYLPAC